MHPSGLRPPQEAAQPGPATPKDSPVLTRRQRRFANEKASQPLLGPGAPPRGRTVAALNPEARPAIGERPRASAHDLSPLALGPRWRGPSGVPHRDPTHTHIQKLAGPHDVARDTVDSLDGSRTTEVSHAPPSGDGGRPKPGSKPFYAHHRASYMTRHDSGPAGLAASGASKTAYASRFSRLETLRAR